MDKLRTLWSLHKKAFQQFNRDNLWVQAAGLAYYTIFALPPILLIILRSTSVFVEREMIRSSLFGEIKKIFGRESATQLSETLSQIGIFEGEWWSIAVGIIGLFITSTTVFVTIQQTLNQIFRVQPDPENEWWRLIRDRLLSFAFLLSLGFILLVSLLINAAVSALGGLLSRLIPGISYILLEVTSTLLPILVVAVLFAAIFRFLPDVKLKWKDIWVGSILTTFLFSIGKYCISFYISHSQAANLYQAAGSVMVIMLWVFYASLIFLFGAVFTRQYAQSDHREVEPSSYAVKIVRKEKKLNSE